MPATAHDLSSILIELGAAIVGLALLARLARRWSISAIPLYLVAGLCFGNGGIAPLNLSENFISVGAEIGVLLLLFMLGLEYSGEELKTNLRAGLPSGLVDLLLNFPPGLIAGLLMGWRPIFAVLLGGVTYISSSGVIAKVLVELKRMDNPETPRILSILVLEDLAMAVYLPLVGVLLAGGGPQRIAISVAIAILAVFAVLYIAVRYGPVLSQFAEHESDEIVLLSTLGAVILVAGVAQNFKVSGAIGGVSRRDRALGTDCTSVREIDLAAARPLCRDLLLFLWAGDRSSYSETRASDRASAGGCDRHHKNPYGLHQYSKFKN